METKEILVIFDAFKLDSKTLEDKVDFIKSFFAVDIDALEIKEFKDKQRLVNLILIRLEQMEPCPDCNGLQANCSSCYGTGKKNIYKEEAKK